MSANAELPHGVTMQQSSLGGFAVYVGGRQAGWIHESGDMWNAYLRRPGEPGRPLGRFSQLDAVRRVAFEAGWPGRAGDSSPNAGPGSAGAPGGTRSAFGQFFDGGDEPIDRLS
jgi:hypothetical protein